LAKTLTGKQLFCGRTPEGKYAAKRKHFSRSIYFACALLKICTYVYKAKGVKMGDENTKRPTKYVLFLYQNLERWNIKNGLELHMNIHVFF